VKTYGVGDEPLASKATWGKKRIEKNAHCRRGEKGKISLRRVLYRSERQKAVEKGKRGGEKRGPAVT